MSGQDDGHAGMPGCGIADGHSKLPPDSLPPPASVVDGSWPAYSLINRPQ